MKFVNFQLINGVEMSKLNPLSFIVPSEVEKKQVTVGSYVKIGLELINAEDADIKGERMWFKVLDIKENGTFLGELNNDPVVVSEHIKFGDKLTFTSDNILEIF